MVEALGLLFLLYMDNRMHDLSVPCSTIHPGIVRYKYIYIYVYRERVLQDFVHQPYDAGFFASLNPIPQTNKRLIGTQSFELVPL